MLMMMMIVILLEVFDLDLVCGSKHQHCIHKSLASDNGNSMGTDALWSIYIYI